MSDSKQKSNKGLIIILILLFVIVIVLVAVIAFLLGRKGNGDNGGATGSSEPTRQVAQSSRVVVTEENADSVMEEMRKAVEEGMFECQMSMTWNFDDGKSASRDAYVANSTNNKFPIYFDVYINDTEELLYSSPVIPVGSDLKNIKLEKELPAGNYEALVMYTLIRDEQTQEVVSQAGFIIDLNVLN